MLQVGEDVRDWDSDASGLEVLLANAEGVRAEGPSLIFEKTVGRATLGCNGEGLVGRQEFNDKEACLPHE